MSTIILFVCTSAHCEGEEKGMSDSGPHMVIGKTARDEEKRAIRQIPRGEWKLGLVLTREKKYWRGYDYKRINGLKWKYQLPTNKKSLCSLRYVLTEKIVVRI